MQYDFQDWCKRAALILLAIEMLLNNGASGATHEVNAARISKIDKWT